MSDFIEIESSRLHLTIRSVPGVVEAGRAAQLALTLFNTGDELDEARLQVEGLDPTWVCFTPAADIAVFPGEATSAVLTIEVPLAAAPGYYTYTLRAESRGAPGEELQQVLQFSVIPAVIPQPAVGTMEKPEAQPVAVVPEPEQASPIAAAPEPGPPAGGAPSEVPSAPIQPQEPAPPKLVMPRSVMPLETAPPPEAQSAPRAGEAGGATVVVPAVPVPPQEPAPPKIVMPHSVMPLESTPPPETPAPGRVPLSAPQSPVPPPRSQDALLKSTKIGLQFDRTQLALGPGETATVAVTVTNLGRIVDTVQLEIYGLPAGWSGVTPVTVTLQPGEAGQTTLTLSPPAQATAGATTFFVRARSWVEAAEITEAALTLAVRAQVRFSLKLEPPQASGERQAAYELRVANEGNAPLALALAGKDDARSCSYVFQPAVLTVAPRSEGKARVVVQAAGPLPGNQPQPVFFTLGVTPEGQPELAQQIAGQFMRLPAPPATMDLRPRAFTDPRQGVYALRVNNPGAAEVTYALSASDPDNACLYMFDPALVHAPAGQGVDVRLTVRARELNTANAAREVQFTIAANPVGGGAALAPLAGKFVQPANPNLALSLNPPQTSAAGPAQYVLTVQNPKPVPVTVTLQALDAADACACVFNPNTLALGPNTQGQAMLAVTPKDRMLPGEQRRVHVFTVTAAASSGERAQIEGRLAQLPGEESRAVSRETRRAGGCLLWLPVALVLLVLGLAGLDVGCHLGDGAPPSGACQALGIFDPVSAPIAGLLKGGPQATAIVEVTPAIPTVPIIPIHSPTPTRTKTPSPDAPTVTRTKIPPVDGPTVTPTNPPRVVVTRFVPPVVTRLVFPTPTEIPGDTGLRVTGRVMWNYSAVPGATILLKDKGSYYDMPILAKTLTDADGNFTLDRPPVGAYMLYAVAPSAEYWEWTGRSIDIAAGQVVDGGTFYLSKKVELLAPAYGATVATTTPTLSWAAFPDATRYEVYVYSAAGQLAFRQSLSGTASVTSSLAAGTYSWSVTAYNAGNIQIAYYSSWSFTVQP